MIVETLILDGDERVEEIWGDLGERHINPLLLEDRKRQLVLVVEDRRRLIHDAHPRDGGAIRKPLTEPTQNPGGPTHRQHSRKPERSHDADREPRMLTFGIPPVTFQLIQAFPQVKSH